MMSEVDLHNVEILLAETCWSGDRERHAFDEYYICMVHASPMVLTRVIRQLLDEVHRLRAVVGGQ